MTEDQHEIMQLKKQFSQLEEKVMRHDTVIMDAFHDVQRRVTRLENLFDKSIPTDALDTYLEYDELDKRITALENK